MVLFIGDSLAVGTPLQRVMPNHHVVTRARVGIGTRAGVRAFLHPLDGASVVVVSLGSNDTNPREVSRQARRVRRATAGRCLLWVRVAGVPSAAAIDRALHAAGVRIVPWHSRVLHPSPAGYRRRARLIARYVRVCEHRA
jgi:lysophospholipase L1-like esterase